MSEYHETHDPKIPEGFTDWPASLKNWISAFGSGDFVLVNSEVSDHSNTAKRFALKFQAVLNLARTLRLIRWVYFLVPLLTGRVM